MPVDLLERQLPRSAVRHRPMAPDAINTQAKTPRASRARQHHEPHTTGGPPSVHTSTMRGPWLIYLVLGMLMAMLLLWLGQMLWSWVGTVSDDIHYGRPRTTQVDHFVGHETGNTPSHFVAVNLGGQVYVIEIPGGSPNSSRLLVGPHLVGSGSDLAPITLSFVGNPHTPDLVVEVNGIEVKFHNTGSEYVPTSE